MIERSSHAVRISHDVGLDPADAFELLLAELATALQPLGLRLEIGPDGRAPRLTAHGADPDEGTVVGRVRSWEPGERITLEWHPKRWDPEETSLIDIRAEALEGGARLMIEATGWGGVIGDDVEAAGWFASEVAGPFLRAMAPEALGDWMTDRQARRPSGPGARDTYRDPLYHYPNFRVILSELALEPADYLLEVGCGGGALLKMALESGCRAAAVDHSGEMVRVATEQNGDAIDEGHLEIREASAYSLPFPDERFTCAVMTGVLGFLADPVAALAEIRRVLGPGGRAVILGSDPELRGTPAAPEPFASRLRFYDEDELEGLGRSAGFDSVNAVWREMYDHAREAGVPEEHLPLFEKPGRFLLLRKA